jgi:hypothetical protein
MKWSEQIERACVIAGAIFTLSAVVIAYWQLGEMKRAVDVQSSESKAARSVDVAFQYLTSDVLSRAKEAINKATKNGTDYSGISTNAEAEAGVRLILNYLETVASGINNRAYDESIVCHHLRRVVEKQVQVHIKGQTLTGVVKANPEPMAESEYRWLVHYYERWKSSTVCPS